MDVIAKINKLKNEHGWTEYQLAQNSGVPQSTISSWHRNNNIPTITTLELICKAFGITMSQFFAESNIPLDLTDEQKEILEKWNMLDEKKKKVVIQLMDSM